MQLIVGHTAPDFDALASMALAKLLHPGAEAVLIGGLGAQLEAFLRLYRDELELLTADNIDLDTVTALIVVDTADPSRIPPFDSLLGKVPVTLYDHHPRPKEAIAAAHGVQREVGATATILTLLLESRGIPIPQALASLALLGIHDDTGSLTFDFTRAEDYEAAAMLLRAGASLDLVKRFNHEHYAPEHRRLFAEMLRGADVHQIRQRPVVIGQIDSDVYVHGLAPLCNQLLSFFNADAAFIVATMEAKTLLIGRSAGAFDVGAAIAEAFGGGGHAGAGFARTDVSSNEVKAQLLSSLTAYGHAPVRAKDVMSSPVNTVRSSETIAAAQALLERLGHSGLPVVNDHDELVGIVSRRHLDRASQHQLSQAPVSSLMTKRVITAYPTTPLNDIEDLIEKHNIGRVPVVDAAAPAQVVGIVSRSDLISARHKAGQQASQTIDRAKTLLTRLPHNAQDLLKQARDLATGGQLYLVGGTVRDLLLGVSMQDLDLSIEGIKAETLGKRLQQVLGGSLSCHQDFSTCTLTLASGLVLDIATARDEYYPRAGALPEVQTSDFRKDIERRDFTINALAVRLTEPVQLLDPYNGLADLEAKYLRTLHPLSFTEDPTRILRGSRLAGRLNLVFEEETLAQLEQALAQGAQHGVSKARLKAELELTLAETQVAPALKILSDIGALSELFGLSADHILLAQLDTLRYRAEVPAESYLLALFLELGEAQLAKVLERFHWPKRYLDSVRDLQHIRRAGDLSREQFTASTTSERAVIQAFSSDLAARMIEYAATATEPVVRGRDLLEMGLAPGPAIGNVLDKLATARHKGEVSGYEEELELARTLVRKQKLEPDQLP